MFQAPGAIQQAGFSVLSSASSVTREADPYNYISFIWCRGIQFYLGI